VSADFDRDGLDDIAVTVRTDDALTILYGMPGGGLGNRQDHDLGDGPVRLATGDLNVDGLLDLAVTNEHANTVSILYGIPEPATFLTAGNRRTTLAPQTAGRWQLRVLTSPRS